MSLGKVTVWKMSEEERLAYIAKHPIVPTEKPKDAKFSTDAIDYTKANERKKESLRRRGKKIDLIDKEKLRKQYLSGVRLPEIAKDLNINISTLKRYISDLRHMEPEKWPYRAKK